MKRMFGIGTAAALIAIACPTGDAKAQFINYGVGGFGGPFNSGYGIYAPGYSRGLSIGFGTPFYGGYGVPYSYGAYRPYYGTAYGYRPYYGGYNTFRSFGNYGGYRGGFYGRRW